MITRLVGPYRGYYVTLASLPVGELGERHLGMYRVYQEPPSHPFDNPAVTTGTTTNPRTRRREALADAEDSAFDYLDDMPVRQPGVLVSQPLHVIAYVSTVTATPTNKELQHLLAAARDRNEQFDITGMLIYDDGQFMQWFEGPAPHTELIYWHIRKDPLHRDLVELARCDVHERTFPVWSMGWQTGPRDTWAGSRVKPILEGLGEGYAKSLLSNFLAR